MPSYWNNFCSGAFLITSSLSPIVGMGALITSMFYGGWTIIGGVVVFCSSFIPIYILYQRDNDEEISSCKK